jgi:hypothetical protein
MIRLAFIACLALLVGCSSATGVPVTGKVTLDGEPVENAAVMFMPSGPGQPATGATDKAGNFALHIGGQTDLIPPGQYQVGITKKNISGVTSADGLSGEVGPQGIKEEWIVPQKYSDPKTSGLTADVQPGMKPLEFNLSK